jgi:hypothetical protein
MFKILPYKGRWQCEALTEGYRPHNRASPLHHRYAAVPLPLQGRIFREIVK